MWPPHPRLAAEIEVPFRRRAAAFWLRSWPGWILLGAIATWLVARTTGIVPGPVANLAVIVVWLGGLYWGARFLVRILRRFLWRIRTKLLLSYLFIAVVPVILLTGFFSVAGLLFSSLVASGLMSDELARQEHELRTTARLGVAGLPADDAAARAVVLRRLGPSLRDHPTLSYCLERHGVALAHRGDSPCGLPSWVESEGFAGLIDGAEVPFLRGAMAEGETSLVLDLPLDRSTLRPFAERTGIHLLSTGAKVKVQRGGMTITIDSGDRGASPDPSPATGATNPPPQKSRQWMSGFATPTANDWNTGRPEQIPLAFDFSPTELVSRLSPGAVNMGDLLVAGVAALGIVFLVVYAVALVIGVLLAFSITRGVHALFLGTRRLREGDFLTPVRVTSRDQLGELAESFNLMARGIENLLVESSEKQRLEEELRIARHIQMSLLPAPGVGLPGLRVAALCLPAEEVGGDYYDLLPLSESRMGVLVADVSGKGTSAALYMAELKGLILSLSRIHDSPARLLKEANRILSTNLDSRSFITMSYAIVDVERRSIRHARAGHNPAILFEAKTGKTRVLQPGGLGLGLDPGPRFDEILEEMETPLEAGDVYLFFTDGLSEAMNSEAELFGETRLRNVLQESEGLPSEEVKERILEAVQRFVGGAAQHDDMTLVILEVMGREAAVA